MDSSVLKESRFHWQLLGYRLLLALFALYSIIEQPVRTALPAIIVLGVLLFIGEGIYKAVIAYDERMLRLQKERELREQRAEEARLRQEALKRAQEESAKQFDAFDKERPSEAEATSAPTVTEKSATS